MKTKKVILISAASLMGVLVAVYVVMALFFTKHVFMNTSLKNINLSGCSTSAVDKRINNTLADYVLTLKTRDDDTEAIKAQDVSLRYVTEGYGNKIISSQKVLLWPVHLFRKDVLSADFELEYDKDAFDKMIKTLECVRNTTVVEPKDAYISDYIPGEGFQIIPEVSGNMIDTHILSEKISEALINMEETLDLEDSGCYIEPKTYASDETLIEKAEYLNKFTNTRITYHFGEEDVVIDGDMVYGWMTIKKNGKVKLDEEKIREYVSSLGSKYDTIFRPRTFKTTYGETVNIKNGDYGWWMNRSAEADEVIKLIKKGEVCEREPVYYQKAAEYGSKDYGDTYVEVNLTAQHLFFYKDGQLVLESDFVSGKDTPERRTPDGVYGITYKERDATLVGEDYETPVSYWMPFNGNIGLHDATWRSKFGSNLYKANGSHGCVNLPFYIAQKIYENVDKGTAVICYELPGTQSSSITSQGDKEIAQFVVDAIERIGPVDKSRKATLQKTLARIRQCYNELTSSQKRYVKNLKKLQEAENELKNL